MTNRELIDRCNSLTAQLHRVNEENKRLKEELERCSFNGNKVSAEKPCSVVRELPVSKAEEHSEKPSVDMSAHPTALMLAAVLSAEAHDEIQKRVLYEFGYHIGRWIYLVDAADDIEKDIKSNGFNPFVNKKTGEVKSSDFIKAVLNQSLARAYDAYNLLNFTDFKGILDNMMLLGFPASQNRVTSKLDTEVNNE